VLVCAVAAGRWSSPVQVSTEIIKNIRFLNAPSASAYSALKVIFRRHDKKFDKKNKIFRFFRILP